MVKGLFQLFLGDLGTSSSLPPSLPPSLLPSQDTLVVSGYSLEESEELLARVISVIDSTDHFLGQTTTVLQQVRAVVNQFWQVSELLVVFIIAGLHSKRVNVLLFIPFCSNAIDPLPLWYNGGKSR